MLKKLETNINIFFVFITLIHTLFIGFIWFHQIDNFRADAKSHFENDVARDVSAISNRLESYADTLYNIRGLFVASDKVTLNEWNVFLDSFGVLTRYPGITSIGYAQYSKTEDIDKTISLIKDEYSSDLDYQSSIVANPNPDTEDHFIAKYRYPFDSSIKLIGFDFFSEEKRRNAIIEAVRSGSITKTLPLTLLSDTSGTTSFVLFLPVYKKYAPIDTIEERVANVEAVALLSFNFNDLMASLWITHDSKPVNFSIISKNITAEGTQDITLYEENIHELSNITSASIPFKFADKEWSFNFYTGEFYDVNPIIIRNTHIFFSFILLSGYITFLIVYMRLRKRLVK